MPHNTKQTVSLVLGSGGARGLAHIGVIRWLEEHDFKIESISGCSMGALVGGVYAAGKLDDFETWVRAITKVEIVRLLDLSWKMSGLVKGDKLFNRLTDIVGDVAIEQLPIRYTAVASDIAIEKEVWINSGQLFDAIRASISLPLFFTPVRYRGSDLIDGGVLNPVPIAPTFNDNTDLTIAVNLGGKVSASHDDVPDSEAKGESGRSIVAKVSDFVDNITTPKQGDTGPEWAAYDIANQAFDAMQSTIARQKLAAYPADHLIEIARNACGTLDFDCAAEMIELGYTKAQEQLGDVT
ncbi:patatin-like phospholipase family protein [Pontibacter sp. JAM-7]|uniref:patatin-like phospholipase family protein n=1 Tax=Pontibacter sp. JAM-7 TaxID=3366581 RepID=UPI003AF5ECFE